MEEVKILDYETINRGNVYWAAIPFSEERPFKIFSLLKNASVTGKKKNEDEFTFDGSIDEDGKRHSDEIDVVVRHKRRMAIVVQDDNFNHDKDYDFVYVVPLTTFNSNSDKIAYFKENKDNPSFHYVGKINGKESVANISDIKRIHKSLLLDYTYSTLISDENMKDICVKIGTFMQIDEIEKCKECKYNYEKYISIEKSS